MRINPFEIVNILHSKYNLGTLYNIKNPLCPNRNDLNGIIIKITDNLSFSLHPVGQHFKIDFSTDNWNLRDDILKRSLESCLFKQYGSYESSMRCHFVSALRYLYARNGTLYIKNQNKFIQRFPTDIKNICANVDDYILHFIKQHLTDTSKSLVDDIQMDPLSYLDSSDTYIKWYAQALI